MKPEDINKMLFVSTSADYGDKYVEHLLEQYKVYIASAERISDRRQKSNDFFLALNTALVALLGFVATKASPVTISWLLTVAPIAGATMCYLWYRIIQSHKNLNDAKYRVLHAIESRLPMALYDTEWEVLGRGKDTSKYWAFTHIELLVPWIFIAIYTVLFSVSVGIIPIDHRAVCPDAYGQDDAGSAAYLASTDKWTNDFFDHHPDADMTDWAQARRQFWIDNHCTAALERYEQAKAGKADPKVMEAVNKVIQEELGRQSTTE
ncbi:MAG: hypothetical protein AAB458_01595 [Patescibacteria group bacterium]